MDPVAIAVSLIQLVIQLVGHEKASELVSQEAMRTANLAADAVAEARGLT